MVKGLNFTTKLVIFLTFFCTTKRLFYIASSLFLGNLLKLNIHIYKLKPFCHFYACVCKVKLRFCDTYVLYFFCKKWFNFYVTFDFEVFIYHDTSEAKEFQKTRFPFPVNFSGAFSQFQKTFPVLFIVFLFLF